MVKSFLLLLIFVTVIALFAIISMIKFATELDDHESMRPVALKFAKDVEFLKEVGVIRLRSNHSYIASTRLQGHLYKSDSTSFHKRRPLLRRKLKETQQFPYVVAITARTRSKGWSFICFGGVIKPQWILTAAHCKKPDHTHRALLYSDYMRNRTQTYSVIHWKTHEHFKRNNSLPKFDIAVAKLDTDVPGSSEVAEFSDLKAEKIEASIWKTVIAMDQTTYLTNDLDMYSFNLAKDQTCYEHYGIHLDNSLLCVDMSTHSDCFVTEFGPIFARSSDRIVGVLTNVKPNDCDKKVAVFTNVSSYVDWVVKAIETEKTDVKVTNASSLRVSKAGVNVKKRGA